jgi:hypothetical protein
MSRRLWDCSTGNYHRNNSLGCQKVDRHENWWCDKTTLLEYFLTILYKLDLYSVYILCLLFSLFNIFKNRLKFNFFYLIINKFGSTHDLLACGIISTINQFGHEILVFNCWLTHVFLLYFRTKVAVKRFIIVWLVSSFYSL